MFTKIEKAPACQPTLYPTNSGEPESSPFVYEPSNDDRSPATLSSTEDELEDEGVYSIFETPYGDYEIPASGENLFVAVTPETTQAFIDAGCLDLLGFWVVLAEYLYPNGSNYRAVPLARGLLAGRMNCSIKTIDRHVARLEAAGLLTQVHLDQHPKPGTRRNGPSCYLPHLTREKKVKAVRSAVVSSPSNVTVDNSLRGAATDGDETATVSSNQNTSTTGTDSSGYETTLSAIGTDLSVSYSIPKEREISLERLAKQSEPITAEQLKALEGNLTLRDAVFELYGIDDLRQLTNRQASGLIQHTLGKNSELTQRLNRLADQMNTRRREKELAEMAAFEAEREKAHAESVPMPDKMREITKQMLAGWAVQ